MCGAAGDAMCTIIVLNEHVKDHPLVVAANRDERYDRPSHPPRTSTVVGPDGVRTLIMPLDGLHGGTWIGVTQDGWFVALTNQDDPEHQDTSSRGHIVLKLLEAGNHRTAARILAQLDLTAYNPFNVVFGRPGAMFLSTVSVGVVLDMEPLPPGVTVISNDCVGTRYQRKANHAHALACGIDEGTEVGPSRDALFRLLADHGNSSPDPFQALCVHTSQHAFGTRSTSVVTVSNDGRTEYWYSEGAPCQSTGLELAGSMLHLDLRDLTAEAVELTDADIEVIG